MGISAKVDISKAIKKLGAAQYPKAIARALNKTATTARAQAGRNIRDAGYGIKVGAVKDAISIRRASPTELRSVVRATGRPIPLIKYSARQTAKGVTVAVKNGRKLITHAFIATMGSGHKGVFIRTGNAHKKVRKNGRVIQSGLPIKELFGPSIPSAFANDVVQEAVIGAIRDRFPVVLRQELKFIGVLP